VDSNEPKSYITHKLDQGRLGNMLFQIATTIATAKENNAVAIFENWKYKDYFKNSINIGKTTPTNYYIEPYFHYTEINLNESLQKNADTVDKVFNLSGYYQSEKYWQNHTELIREQFEFNEDLSITVLLHCFNFSSVCCAIHVRRTDYVDNDYYEQLDMGYYNSAIAKIKSLVDDKIKFMIFSDDIQWCKSNFIGKEFIFIEGNSDIEDLFLMSQCDHFIIANSSFSWWSSYLSANDEKVIIAPQKNKWFGSDIKLNVDDLYCENWVLL
jgi:hypothetical protein